MRAFMAEDNLCAQNLLKLVSHGNAIVAEILRLKDHTPIVFLFETKDIQQKYQDVILDFNYFKISETQDKKISSIVKLQDLDDDLKEKYLELINRFYLLFENIYQYIIDLNIFIEQLHDGGFIQQSIESVLRDVEGKQLLCESLYLYGSMLLLCDLYIPGPVRERLLVAFYRYSTSQSQSNVDDVCKLLRDTGFNQQMGRRPSDYPVEFFNRINIRLDFIEKVIGKLRSEDIYNQLAVYTIPEHQASALATQASMLVVCLFFAPHYLNTDTSKMREIADKFFPSNWIVPIYMGVTLNVIDYWENFKAAKMALNNTCNAKMVKEVFSKRGNSVSVLINKTQQLLKEGTLTDDFVLDNINKILNLLLNSNLVIRWLLLHTSDVIFYDNNKKTRQLKELVQKESNHSPLTLLELLISTAELELKVREVLTKLLENKSDSWNTNKALALEAINNLSELFSGAKPITKVQENEQLKLWFDNIAKQITSLSDTITTKSIKKITQLIQALDEVEEFHGIKSTSTTLQFLSESKDALKNILRAATLKEDTLVTLETVADVSYAWCTIDTYTIFMQDSIKENPAVTSRLRALFLKLASAMEIPLLRINQARSEDLVSVSQYYSNELIKYIQKVLQVIPQMVFSIVEKIIELQTWAIKEVPTRLEKDKLRDYAQLEQRIEVAKLTHSASTFTTGILDMRSTLVGVIRVDPAQLLEDGLLNELDCHISKKFVEFLEPQRKKASPSNLMPRLQKLAESMDGYKRSLEYIQDYINIHGLRIWLKQVSAIISESVSKEISLRKGVTLYSPSACFMGSLARQVAQLVDARTCIYLSMSTAWYDAKSQNEVVNSKTFAKLNEAVGVVGLFGLDTLYAHMIKNQLQNFHLLLKVNQDKLPYGTKCDVKEIEQIVTKNQKLFQQMSEVLVVIGTLQIIRKHIAYQLNTTCKFDSAHLEAALRTLNECLINELKHTTNDSEKTCNVSANLLQNMEEYLVRCGIHEPFEKLYIKAPQDLLNLDLGQLSAITLISQLPKLQICTNTGDIITRKPGENIDGYPFLIGIYTLLRQMNSSRMNAFVDFLCSYGKAATMHRLKSSDSNGDGGIVVRVLQLFCETFNYAISSLEEKLPLVMLTNPIQKVI